MQTKTVYWIIGFVTVNSTIIKNLFWTTHIFTDKINKIALISTYALLVNNY